MKIEGSKQWATEKGLPKRWEKGKREFLRHEEIYRGTLRKILKLRTPLVTV